MADLKLKILLDAVDKMTAPFKSALSSTEKLKKGMKEATAKVRGLEVASGNIEAFARLKSEARANATALAAAQEKAQAMGRALAEAGGGTKKAQAEFRRARAEVQRLEAAQASNARETAVMRGRLAEAGIDTRKLATAQRTLRRDLDAARQAAERQAKALEAARAKTNALAAARAKMDRTLGLQSKLAVGGAAGMATGGAALAVGSRMAGAGIDFGEQMSAVGAVARIDKTSEAFAKLSAQAQELGANTSFSASQAAEGMQYLAMAGFDAEQMLAAMPGMLDLAKAGATDLGTTADIASNILSGFGMKAGEMGRLGDVMTATFTRSNVNLQMLGATMKYTAPIARQFGASVEDVAAMTGLLGNIGLQGEMAGTSLRALFTRLAAPPKSALDMLMKLGIATQDAAGNMRPITEILADVARKTEKMGKGERLKAFSDIAGMEAGSAFAELVTKGGEGAITKFAEILRASGGEAARVAKQMGDNAAGDLKGFTSAIEGMNIALTETNDSPLRELIQSATGVVRGITAWVRENPKLAGTLVKVAAVLAGVVFTGGALAATVAGLLGPFAMARFALTTLGIHAGVAGGALGLLKGGFGLLGTAASTVFPMLMTGIRAVGMAFAANPIGIAILAIAGAAFLVIKYWEPIKAFFADLWEGISAAFSAAWDVIMKGLSAITAPLSWISSLFGGGGGGGFKIATTASAAAVAAPLAAGAPPPAVPPMEMGGIVIHVHAAPGQDATEIGKAVRREIEKMAAEAQRAGRARLYDAEE